MTGGWDMREKDHWDSADTMFQRSFKVYCEDCNWYVILRRNGGMLSMFINNFNKCPKCDGTRLKTTQPTAWETVNPLEQIRKYYLRIIGK